MRVVSGVGNPGGADNRLASISTIRQKNEMFLASGKGLKGMSWKRFGKYQDKGAYHWRMLYDRGLLRYNPRLHARYDIPVKLLSEYYPDWEVDGLDVGCGEGAFLYKIAREGGNISGLDLEMEALKLAKRKLAGEGLRLKRLVAGSCHELPFPRESFDFVSAIEVIEHLEEARKFCLEVRRVLRPGGVFVCTTPNRTQGQGKFEVRDPYHVREYNPDELGAILDQCFSRCTVYGAYPSWLDTIYVRGRNSGVIDRVIRGLFRIFSLVFWNPYVMSTTESPSLSYKNLVGVCEV